MTGRWQDSAACRTEDPALFFGPDGESEARREVRETLAIAVCRFCPARTPCLDDALAYPAQHGVWGGVGEDRRKSLRHAALKQQRRERAA